MPIGLFDTETPLLALREQIVERLAEVVERGVYILGPEVKAFEQEFAAYLGVRHAIGVANGTDAITIALRALGVGPDDEVVVPSFTFYASAEAIVNAGARPVFCDVDPATRNVTVETVRAVLTPRTKAIVAVDLFGCPAPVPELRELGVPVLEDAAQAAGASLDGRRAGSLGDVGHVLVLSVQEPRVLRGRRRDHDRRRRGRRARAGAAIPRLPRQEDVRVRRLQLASRRAPGGDPARAAARARRLVRPAARGGGRVRRGGHRSVRDAARRYPTAPSPPGICTS